MCVGVCEGQREVMGREGKMRVGVGVKREEGLWSGDNGSGGF